MTPAALAFFADLALQSVVGLVTLALGLWAFVDAARRSPADFDRAGLRPKTTWMALIGISVGICVFMVIMAFPFRGFLAFASAGGFVGIIALCIAAVYLAGPKTLMSGGGYGYRY